MSVAGDHGADGDEKNGRQEGEESEAHFLLEKRRFSEDGWVVLDRRDEEEVDRCVGLDRSYYGRFQYVYSMASTNCS